MEALVVGIVLMLLTIIVALTMILLELRNLQTFLAKVQPDPMDRTLKVVADPETEILTKATREQQDEQIKVATEFVMKEMRSRGSTITPERAREHAMELLGLV